MAPSLAPICDRCGLRRAEATVRHVNTTGPPRVQQLCHVCLAEGRFVAGALATPGLFDAFVAQLLGGAGAGDDSPGAGQPPAGPPPARHGRQVDITRSFSTDTQHVLGRAARVAAEDGVAIDVPHLVGALFTDGITPFAARLGVDPARVLARLPGPSEEAGAPPDGPPRLTPALKRLLIASYELARRGGDAHVGPEHLVLALAMDDESASGEALRREGLTPERVAGALSGVPPTEGGRGDGPPSRTPTLDQFGRDLTDLALRGRLDPVVGRDDEIEQTMEVLSRRTKNNPVLIGEPGVGKTAVVEGIAQSIADDDVPDLLAGRRLVALDLAGMLAGTRYRGEFEERLTELLDEVREFTDELLLFIDEVHTIVGAGAGEGAMDAANMLKPALARGELHVIGATTLDEYRRHVERDAALERRFQPIMVDEPSTEEALAVLCGLRDRYEAFHDVRITDGALEAAVHLSDRYVTDRFLPDKAIDLVDQAAARVRLRQPSRRRDGVAGRQALERDKEQAVAAEDYERAAELKAELDRLADERGAACSSVCPEVTRDDIADVVSRATGVPVSQLTQLERDRLLDLEDLLHERVVGQEEAVRVVAEAVQRSRAGIGDPDRPVGSFLFLGPTGVGKTELARALARSLFGDDDLMVRFDMSEFQERHTVSRLIGAPPGYVGYDEAGQLTEQVRRRPYTVLLLDEIEKAHPDVFNVLLQLLDDGQLTDGQGRRVDFRNTVVIMTSNLGAERLQRQQAVGFRPATGSDDEFDEVRHDVMQVLRRSFRPEFLNRIDEVVVFEPLSRSEVERITGLLVDAVAQRLAGQRIRLDVTDAARSWLADTGFDPEFGARPLRRTIQRTVENLLSRMVLSGELQEGQRAVVDEVDGGLDVTVEDDDTPPPPDWEDGAPPRLTPAGPGNPRHAV